MEERGIKETKEALDASMELLICILDLVKDGAEFKDVFHFIERLKSSPDFSAKLRKGLEGMQHIPAEMADLEMDEIVQLAMLFMQKLPRLAGALK